MASEAVKKFQRDVSEMEGLVGVLELERMELVDALIAQSSQQGYTVEDLEKIALYGNAISSLRDAIAFSIKFHSS